MCSVRNYHRELDSLLVQLSGKSKKPGLLLHSCCAPCSSYVIEYLSGIFDMTLYFYNPNIVEEPEYEKRLFEWRRFCENFPVRRIEGKYEPQKFLKLTEGMEALPEGGARCFLCYELRMRAAAEAAAEIGSDYFTTSLSISPHKNAAKINEIGERLGAEYGVRHLPSDFKKKNGYKRSIELSREYGLYRQDYCGCIYSKRNMKGVMKK
ncbi:hypothetical protein D7X88_15600 [bacterium C-53]|nr:hypothetical protein [Lachnospiraceae bacterium]NBI04386.1 hypothetical protein [Lachnospiraceae bacterium]RKJ08283.1 hypothetical protein D7X88_15600 [bacterium C-53]